MEIKEIPMIGSLMMRVSVVLLLIGLLWGIEMGVRQDFAMMPAHAHLNLVGGVLLFVFGLYYSLSPAPAAAGWQRYRAGSISSARWSFRLGSPSSSPRGNRWWQFRSSDRLWS
jgi:hypothetical protein